MTVEDTRVEFERGCHRSTTPAPAGAGSRSSPGLLPAVLQPDAATGCSGAARAAETQGGVPALVLETIGAKSGETRYAMLGYLEEGRAAWLVMASLAGSARNPSWLYNLAQQPEATIELGDGRRLRVDRDDPRRARARRGLAEGLEVRRPSTRSTSSVTDRAMPIVRLRELDGDAAALTLRPARQPRGSARRPRGPSLGGRSGHRGRRCPSVTWSAPARRNASALLARRRRGPSAVGGHVELAREREGAGSRPAVLERAHGARRAGRRSSRRRPPGCRA